MQKFLHVPVYITMITFCMVMFIASAFAFDVLEKPGNYNDINTIVETLIPDYYEDDEKVQCGGWDFEDTVAPIDPLSRNP
ncbi:hypothetical protein KJ652_03225, partial [Patescibacteria group bacterium]|nr:hypothetical protein [Patescibacteria group bacterium]